MHSPGCVNGLQPYVPLACLTPHPALCGDGWQPLLLFPSLSFPFQQPPHTSNCLSIQALPSPTAVHFSCLFSPSASSFFSSLSPWWRCTGGIKHGKTTGHHLHKQCLTEGGGLFQIKLWKAGHWMLLHFSTLYHLMVVTIETDDQTGLVATIAVSVSKLVFFLYSFIGTICSILLIFHWKE